MDSGKIFIVNLSKGRTGELNSKLLGMIFIMKFQAAAMSRANIDAKDRRQFCLYVDEFQNFQTDSFESILSEARKYGLNLIVANQFITQLSDEIREAIFGNIGTVVAHRVGTADAELLEKLFRPVFDVDDLQRLPTANSIVRTLIKGVPTQPFSMADLPILMLGKSNKQLAGALKQLSAAKHGRPKSIVEAEIYKRLSTEEITMNKPDLSAFDKPKITQPGIQVPTSQSTFLDDWLAKRRTGANKKMVTKNDEPSTKSNDMPNKKPQAKDELNNISSSSIETPEIDSIARQLKQKIISKEKPAVKQNASELNGIKTDKHGTLEHDDVIHIDKDGNLSYSE
jgi:hypothetical protein